jgi:hypothetical protein
MKCQNRKDHLLTLCIMTTYIRHACVNVLLVYTKTTVISTKVGELNCIFTLNSNMFLT